MLVERIAGFCGLEVALYSKIARDRAVQALAGLAIRSAQTEAGKKGIDGISYLISVKRAGIATPQMDEYDTAIVRQNGTRALEEALAKVRA